MSTTRPAASAVAVALALGLTACSGSGGGEDRAGCAPRGTAATYRTLVDDQGALPADNWVPVVEATGRYRTLLTALDTASRGLSSADLAAIAPATGSARRAAVQAAVADVPTGERGPRLTLVVPSGETGKAVGAYYESALRRLGATPAVSQAGTEAALAAVRSGDADVAVVGLGDLASSVGAELDAGDASSQVQTVATAALEETLALGATAAASSTPQVLLPDTVTKAARATTLSQLAEACGDVPIAVAGGATSAAATGAAQAVAKTYGFHVGEDSATAVAVVTAP